MGGTCSNLARKRLDIGEFSVRKKRLLAKGRYLNSNNFLNLVQSENTYWAATALFVNWKFYPDRNAEVWVVKDKNSNRQMALKQIITAAEQKSLAYGNKGWELEDFAKFSCEISGSSWTFLKSNVFVQKLTSLKPCLHIRTSFNILGKAKKEQSTGSLILFS